MLTRHELAGGHWIDLERPTHEEIEKAAADAGFGKRIAREISDPTPAPLVLPEERAVLLVLHVPAITSYEEPVEDHEVDFIVTPRHLVTVRYGVVAPIHELHKVLEANELLGAPRLSIEELLELITSKFFAAVRAHVALAARMLEHVEHSITREGSRRVIHEISRANRSLLHLEATLASQEEPFASFLEALQGKDFFGPTFRDRLVRLLAERDQVARLLATHRKVAAELRDTNSALLNATQNEIMKTLTVVTFIILPLTLIADLFAMDLLGRPLANNPNGFLIVVGSMGIVGAFLTLFFVRKRWL